jgi:hypothetical protein
MPLWRGYCEETYTTCGRCGRKVPISDCSWDAGLLVCTMYNCKDRNINGAFEVAVAQEASRDRQELVPDPKLVNPADVSLQINHISASAGSYK